MSLERKQFLVWLTVMTLFVAFVQVLYRMHPEYFAVGIIVQ
jgi:hypothetical protein